jgi:hypothetical protein
MDERGDRVEDLAMDGGERKEDPEQRTMVDNNRTKRRRASIADKRTQKA